MFMSMRYRKNLIGPQVRKLRQERGWSLDQLANEFAQQGIFISAHTLERIESRREFMGSIEVYAFATIFRTGVEHLYPPDSSASNVLEELRLLQQNAHSAKDHQGIIEARIFAGK
jgi:transcriptional regulator with XRE-family HTH domain